MGTAFDIAVYHASADSGEHALQLGVNEVRRIEKLLSEYDPASAVSEINENAGSHAVQVPEEVYQLIRRCLSLSDLTQGAFDITLSPLKHLYRFDRKNIEMPAPETVREALKITGYKHIHLGKNNRVYLPLKGMKISFASIGKGYAADKVIKLWKNTETKSGYVNASGDLSILGRKPDRKPWRIGIADPVNPGLMLGYLPLKEGSVATSGDYEQYFEWKGKRFAHTLNPKTGYPVEGIRSVTVKAPGAELCDALATAVTVMGIETGLHFINQLPETHCLIVDDENLVHCSKNITFEQK